MQGGVVHIHINTLGFSNNIFSESLFKLGDSAIWKRLVGGHVLWFFGCIHCEYHQLLYFNHFLALDVVNKEENQRPLFTAYARSWDFVQASIEKGLERGWVGLKEGVAVRVNTWLCIVVDELSKVEGSNMPKGFYNLLGSERKAFASDQTA